VEALVLAGALDNLGDTKREQYFGNDQKGTSFTEQLIRYGSKAQTEKNNVQQTLFGSTESGFELQKPEAPEVEPWSKLENLNKEKELIGIYLSAHPLDDFKLELDNFCNVNLTELNEPAMLNGRDITIGGIVSEAKILTSKKGALYGRLTIEDFTDSYEFTFWAKDFENFRRFFYVGYPIMIKGRFNPSRFREGELEFSPKSIHMLSEAREEFIKMITLSLFIEEITDELIQNIKLLVTSSPGKVKLKIRLADSESNLRMEMFSRSYRVGVTKDLVKLLNKMNINYKVN
jgi:DNA polymerase-3 subunit alpha